MKTNWRRRWERTAADLTDARAENLVLRTALDELNAETEQLFNDAAQEGVEKAKTHLIKQQAAALKQPRKEANA